MLLSAATDAFLTSLRAEHRSERTIAAYARDLASLRGAIGDVSLEEVTPGHLLAWAQTHRGATASANRARSAVRNLFGFAIRMWWILRDPTGVLRIKSTRPAPPTTLSRDGETRVLATMAAEPTWEAHRDALMLRTMVATGLRVSSVVALDVAGIDAEVGALTVPVKGGHTMLVRIDVALAEELLELTGDVAVFTTRKGRRLGVRQVQTRIAEWAERAGLPALHPHALRHTFGSREYARTKDLRAVQVAMGHGHVTTTERYVGVG